MQTSLLDNVVRIFGLGAIVSAIVLIGWNEPLKYRFMTRADIYAYEHPVVAASPGGAWMWEKKDRRLDRGPYNQKAGLSGGYSSSGVNR